MVTEYQTVSNLPNIIDEYVNCNAASDVERGKRFCEWVLKYMYERTDEECDDYTDIAGKCDNSVDAWFEENDVLNIIQTKFNTAHSWAGMTNFYNDMEILISNPYLATQNKIDLCDLVEKIKEYLAESEEEKQIVLRYVTSTNLTEIEEGKAQDIKSQLEQKYPQITLEFMGIKEIEEYIEKELNPLPMRYRNRETKLILQNRFQSNDTVVAEVSLKNFVKFVDDNKEYLFFSNIRNYLKNTTVNQGIIQTFRQTPTDFWYYNNGITIVCDGFEFDKGTDCILKIKTAQIVNGCQTANTILNEYKQLKAKDKTLANNLQGSILVKIIMDAHARKRDFITRYTNNQNSVSGKDFYALDQFHRALQKAFKDELGYYFEIQKKAGLTLKPAEKRKYKGDKRFTYLLSEKFDNILPVKEVVQAYASGMHFMPATASGHLGELAPYGKQWSVLFNSETPNDPYYFLFPFAVMKYGKQSLGYDKYKGETEIKKTCLMLFVCCYFKIVLALLCHLEFYDKDIIQNPVEIKIIQLKNLFSNKNVNIRLLDFADKFVSDYMEDFTVMGLY